MALLIENAFGTIHIDSGAQDSEIEAEVRAALDSGLSPNARDQGGETLLLQAIEHVRLGTIQLLLQRGANPNLAVIGSKGARPVGETPLMRAVFLDAGYFEKPAQRLQIMLWLLRRGANLNARDNAGNTVIMVAALYGKSESVPLLLKQGANFRLRNGQNQTALQLALAPVPRFHVFSPLSNLSHAKTEREKQKISLEHQKQDEMTDSRMEKDVAKHRAVIAKLLKAAGATR